MAGNVGSGKRGADINVVPLIDIVLVLLIIFMVITPLIIKQMEVHLPEVVKDEPTPPPDEHPKPQVVVLVQCQMTPSNPNAQCPNYTVYLGKNPIDENQLGAALTAMTQGWSPDDKIMFFDAQDQVNYKVSVKILDIARGAGITKIGLITDRTNLNPNNPNMPSVPGAPGAPTHG